MSYRSDRHNIIEEFYVPCLMLSSVYSRAVGFFSSTSLSVAAKGLYVFLRGGGHMQLVASPLLSSGDVEAIRRGYANRSVVEEQAITRALDGEFAKLVERRLELLAWLIQYDRLDIKVAVLHDTNYPGVYHEKIGIFSDGHDFVAFSGSPNESCSGLVGNFECIDVYCSWRPGDRERAIDKKDNFTRLWTDCTPSLTVYPFPEACKKSLLRFRGISPPQSDPEVLVREKETVSIPRMPDTITLRNYQENAVKNWFEARLRGTLKMATGSGKTITSLAAATKLYEIGKLEALIITVPFKHLVNQWKREAQKFGLDPICCFESRSKWESSLQTSLYNVKAKSIPFLSLIATNATFSSDAFQQLMVLFPQNTMLIGDEVHNLGSRRLLSSLPNLVPYRLGLSATPERWYDDTGTQELFAYFGPVLQPEFTLKDGLDCGALVPYCYKPIFVNLTDDEAYRYSELSNRIGRFLSSGENLDDPSPAFQALLIKRARLLATAENKAVLLREEMKSRLDTAHTLFYCGDGSVETSDGEMIRHVDEICRILGGELGYRVDTYTAEDSLCEREELQSDFERGALQGLVAIRCLDEGVDLPVIKTAFILASSSNPRQFIQRRGRILRPHPSKQEAEIFDFIVLPPSDAMNYDTERSMLRRELTRYVEFADLAKNAGKARACIVDLQREYGLFDL